MKISDNHSTTESYSTPIRYRQPTSDYSGRVLRENIEDVSFSSESNVRIWYNTQDEGYSLHAHDSLEIIICVRENYETERFEKENEGYRKVSVDNADMRVKFLPWIDALCQVLPVILIMFGGYLVINNEMTIGQLVAFRMLSGQVSGPVLRLVQLWQEYQQASLSVRRIGDIFNSPVERQGEQSLREMPNIEGRISFDNVRFRYRSDASDVLHGISFEIPRNRVVGLVGRSGSGKSTISKLVQRLYIPQCY